MVSIGHLFSTFIFIENIRNIGTKAVKLTSDAHIWSVPKNVPDILSWNKSVFPEQSYVPDIFLVTLNSLPQITEPEQRLPNIFKI